MTLWTCLISAWTYLVPSCAAAQAAGSRNETSSLPPSQFLRHLSGTLLTPAAATPLQCHPLCTIVGTSSELMVLIFPRNRIFPCRVLSGSPYTDFPKIELIFTGSIISTARAITFKPEST
ncbi:hypothetical protein DENSPDRAFT_615429 [Dentipellis sp. KUC8613]|nr:hypothetical protein DENSPDRAFT_615429 [Dentipellis sp. KUC8613]